MSLEKDESNIGEKMDPNAPTCYKCDSISHCTIGRPNKQLVNCPMIISPDITKQAIEL